MTQPRIVFLHISRTTLRLTSKRELLLNAPTPGHGHREPIQIVYTFSETTNSVERARQRLLERYRVLAKETDKGTQREVNAAARRFWEEDTPVNRTRWEEHVGWIIWSLTSEFSILSHRHNKPGHWCFKCRVKAEITQLTGYKPISAKLPAATTRESGKKAGTRQKTLSISSTKPLASQRKESQKNVAGKLRQKKSIGQEETGIIVEAINIHEEETTLESLKRTTQSTTLQPSSRKARKTKKEAMARIQRQARAGKRVKRTEGDTREPEVKAFVPPPLPDTWKGVIKTRAHIPPETEKTRAPTKVSSEKEEDNDSGITEMYRDEAMKPFRINHEKYGWVRAQATGTGRWKILEVIEPRNLREDKEAEEGKMEREEAGSTHFLTSQESSVSPDTDLEERARNMKMPMRRTKVKAMRTIRQQRPEEIKKRAEAANRKREEQQREVGQTWESEENTQEAEVEEGSETGETQEPTEARREPGETTEEGEKVDTTIEDKGSTKATKEKVKEFVIRDEGEILVEGLTRLAEEALQSRRDRAMYYIACTLKIALQDIQKGLEHQRTAQLEIQEGVDHVVGVAEMLMEEIRTGRGKEHEEATEEGDKTETEKK